MKNLKFVESRKHSDIISELSALPGKGAHFTNGVYAYSAESDTTGQAGGLMSVAASKAAGCVMS